eukprot:scaffold3928_cov257-Pinguiococcus_pyrenoidosus.AAC.6
MRPGRRRRCGRSRGCWCLGTVVAPLGILTVVHPGVPLEKAEQISRHLDAGSSAVPAATAASGPPRCLHLDCHLGCVALRNPWLCAAVADCGFLGDRPLPVCGYSEPTRLLEFSRAAASVSPRCGDEDQRCFGSVPRVQLPWQHTASAKHAHQQPQCVWLAEPPSPLPSLLVLDEDVLLPTPPGDAPQQGRRSPAA